MTLVLRSIWITTLSVLTLGISLGVSAQDLWTAAGEGDLKTLKQLIKETEDVDMADPNFGFTPLVSAVIGDQPKAVRLLLKAGANVNQVGMGGNTPLHAAAFLGHADVTKELLKAGANPVAANSEGVIPAVTLEADWATTQNLAAMLQLELNQEEVETGRAKIGKQLEKATEKAAKTDIWLAATMGNAKYVRKLAPKTDLEEPGLDGTVKLISLAATLGHADVVEELLKAGADVNARALDGATALIGAALFGRIDTVKVLLDHGADITVSNNDGTTALSAAQTDMQIVDYIAGMLSITLDYDTTIDGKREVVELLQAQLAE